MKHYFFFPLSLIIFTQLFGMECEEIKPKPIICFNSNQVVYIGKGEDRDKLEKIYGKTFHLNTIFFAVAFKDLIIKRSSYWGLANRELLHPEFISYELIKNCKEDEQLILKLHGKEEQLLCAQHQTQSFRKKRFEQMVEDGFKTFLDTPNCLVEGKESLLEEKILKDEPIAYGKRLMHGENANPEVLKLLKPNT